MSLKLKSHVVSFKTNLYFWSRSYSEQSLLWPLLHKKNLYHCVVSLNFKLTQRKIWQGRFKMRINSEV